MLCSRSMVMNIVFCPGCTQRGKYPILVCTYYVFLFSFIFRSSKRHLEVCFWIHAWNFGASGFPSESLSLKYFKNSCGKNIGRMHKDIFKSTLPSYHSVCQVAGEVREEGRKAGRHGAFWQILSFYRPISVDAESYKNKSRRLIMRPPSLAAFLFSP